MERLLSLPYGSNEEDFVLQYRCQLEAQSKKQTVPPLQQDDRGVAFSTADGTALVQTPSRERHAIRKRVGGLMACPSG